MQKESELPGDVEPSGVGSVLLSPTLEMLKCILNNLIASILTLPFLRFRGASCANLPVCTLVHTGTAVTLQTGNVYNNFSLDNIFQCFC